MTRIFRAKTREGFTIKVLAEILQSNIKLAIFHIDSKGMKLRTMDDAETVLIDLHLKSENFALYRYKPDKPMTIGLTLSHLYKMLKSIKKCDSVELFIDDSKSTNLGIKVIPKENNRVTNSYIKINEDIQNLEIALPTGYKRSVKISSGDFQKTCKSLATISDDIRVSMKGFIITFTANKQDVMEKSVEFGEYDDSDSEDDEKSSQDYDDTFISQRLIGITKIESFIVSF